MLRRFRRVATFVATAAVLASANPSIAGSIRGASGAPGPSLAIRDLGRAPQMQRISVTLVLKYRHADELEKLIALQSDPGSRIYHRFLSNAQFDAYFAPSTGDYARTALALQREGFTISRVYPNRTLIGASAPVAAVERFFHTQIHRVGQAGAGVRYANLTPPVLALDTLAAASLSNVVHVRPAYAFGRADAARRVAAETSVDAVQDGGFESGGYAYWQQQCPQAASSLPGTITSTSPHGGTKDAFLGVTGGYQYAGPSYICQLLTVPKNATLSFWASKTAVPGTNAANSYQTATLVDPFGFPLQTFYTTATTSGGYRLQTFPVAPSLAGRQAMLSFGTYNDGSPDYVNQRVDDVALTGEYVPTPTPAPTQKPTPTPHPTATATGTERPTPTPVPTATARPTPTPVRTATPKPTPAPTGTVAGALYGPDGGYGPIAVANGYDLPVQHGYNGAGRSTGIEIDADFANSDLATYLNYFHIKRSGTVTRETVDGGPAGQSSDSIETTLDVETIAANAPGANVIVYEIPDLSDQSIEDGYNQEVSDDTVDVVNSSFGGCETDDPSFATATNQIAQQGAAKGITFSASSGDQGSNCQGGSLSTEIPAVDPYFTGDGGTTLQVNSNGTYRSETAWSGSGGGVSTIFSLPSYQKGVAGLASSTKRNVPDVAFAADPNSGTSFYYQGYWQGPLGGTSWASPIFCALLTEIDQRTNSRAGFVNPALYQTYASDGYRAFHDVTSGNNGSYSAHTGYDDVTGIGSGRGYYLSGPL